MDKDKKAVKKANKEEKPQERKPRSVTKSADKKKGKTDAKNSKSKSKGKDNKKSKSDAAGKENRKASKSKDSKKYLHNGHLLNFIWIGKKKNGKKGEIEEEKAEVVKPVKAISAYIFYSND